MQVSKETIQKTMRLIGGMTVEELLDNSRSMGELSSQNYDRWVEGILQSERDEYSQWHILNYYSGCVELPQAALKEMHALEKAKDYVGLKEWLLCLCYPILWDAAGFWLNKAETLLELLPYVAKGKEADKQKRFLIWTLVNVWQVRCRNMVMGHERKAGWVDAHRKEYEKGVDSIIAVMGRDEYVRFLFRFNCYWANDRIERFYTIVCEHLATTFSPKCYLAGFCNMNYLYHIVSRCSTILSRDIQLVVQFIADLKVATGSLANQWPSTWEAVESKIYKQALPLYKIANSQLDKALENEVESVLVKREGWKLEKELNVQCAQNTREAIWLGFMAWIVTEEGNEPLFERIADCVFSQYQRTDKHRQIGTFELSGLIQTIYNRVGDKRPKWLVFLDKKVLAELNDFVFVAVLLSGRKQYEPDVVKTLKDRWDAERDVLEIKLQSKPDLWKRINQWMKYEVRMVDN